MNDHADGLEPDWRATSWCHAMDLLALPAPQPGEGQRSATGQFCVTATRQDGGPLSLLAGEGAVVQRQHQLAEGLPPARSDVSPNYGRGNCECGNLRAFDDVVLLCCQYEQGSVHPDDSAQFGVERP